MLSSGKAIFPDVVEWMKNVTTDDIVDALEQAGVDHLVEHELEQRASVCIPAIFPATTGGTNCISFNDRERFYVIVRRVDPEKRVKAMHLLRKMGYSFKEVKGIIDNPPFHFYANESYPTKFLYYDPSTRDENTGGEYFMLGKNVGFSFFVISDQTRDIEKWIETLDDEEREDVIFSLNFYVDLFTQLANEY